MAKKYIKPIGMLVAAVAAMGAFASCAPVTLLNGLTPSSSFQKTKNLSYGNAKHEVLDVYISQNPKADAPVLVFVHGGSWDSGSKGIYKFLAEGFTRSGYDVVVPNYRLYPEAKFPNFLQDNAKAVAFATSLPASWVWRRQRVLFRWKVSV